MLSLCNITVISINKSVDLYSTKINKCYVLHSESALKQESPAVADKPARRLRKVCTVYVRAVGL